MSFKEDSLPLEVKAEPAIENVQNIQNTVNIENIESKRVPDLSNTDLLSTYEYLNWFLTATRNEILNKFHSVPGAFSDGKDSEYKRFVYIKGTRPDRVLLVAHADTVWYDLPIKTKLEGPNVISDSKDHKWNLTYQNNVKKNNTGIGIQADDRAGCAILWKFIESGHSILIANGEERGCIGSKWLMESDYWKNEINSHQFIIEFDRRDKDDIVFYDVGTKPFVSYIKEQTGYIPQPGTFTDIRVLCDTICGVNISVGYYNEHTPEERLNINEWNNTLQTAIRLLGKENIPKFGLYKDDLFTFNYCNSNSSNRTRSKYLSDYEIIERIEKQRSNTSKKNETEGNENWPNWQNGQNGNFGNGRKKRGYRHRTYLSDFSNSANVSQTLEKNEYNEYFEENGVGKIRCKTCSAVSSMDDLFVSRFVCNHCHNLV